MSNRKFHIFVVFIIINILITESASKSNDKYTEGTRFKSVKCQSDKTTISVRYCYMKAISVRIVTLNLGLTFLVPYTSPIYVQLILNYRYGTIFRQVIDTHQHEWCAIMNGGDTNPIIKLTVDQLRKSAGSLFHKCPYEGDLDLNNVTIDEIYEKNEPFRFPEGTYRLDVIVCRNTSQAFKIDVTFENKSPLKESFGR